jgi:flavin-dependent dehydrogenase
MADDQPIHVMGAGLSGLAAATILAKAGREVHVYEMRADSGARFDGDFQGLENWTAEGDLFDEMREWGLEPDSFKSTPFKTTDVVHPDDLITQVSSDRVAFRIVERGTEEHCIDQGFKRMAEAAGVHLHYGTRAKIEDCSIIAAGPKQTSAVAFGEVFKTTFPNHVSLHLNDKLAPGAYAYLIVIDGIGLICTCLWRKQKRSQRFLDETIAWYDEHYPELDRQPIKRVGGKGDFSLPSSYFHNNRYYVGEAGGLQDFMWGFGMRYAITSGALAAKSILGECDYESEIRRRLLPTLRVSAVNRWLLNRVGDRGFKQVTRHWMKDQKKRGDGLVFIEKLYRPGLVRKALWPFVKLGMLRKIKLDEGRTARRLPFRKSLRRDIWIESDAAKQVAEQWREVRVSGGVVSFAEDDQ